VALGITYMKGRSSISSRGHARGRVFCDSNTAERLAADESVVKTPPIEGTELCEKDRL